MTGGVGGGGVAWEGGIHTHTTLVQRVGGALVGVPPTASLWLIATIGSSEGEK